MQSCIQNQSGPLAGTSCSDNLPALVAGHPDGGDVVVRLRERKILSQRVVRSDVTPHRDHAEHSGFAGLVEFRAKKSRGENRIPKCLVGGDRTPLADQ